MQELIWHEVKFPLLVPTAAPWHGCPLPPCIATTTTVPGVVLIFLWQESRQILPIRAFKRAARVRNGRIIRSGAAESSTPHRRRRRVDGQ